jgi:hypothetical protein
MMQFGGQLVGEYSFSRFFRYIRVSQSIRKNLLRVTLSSYLHFLRSFSVPPLNKSKSQHVYCGVIVHFSIQSTRKLLIRNLRIRKLNMRVIWGDVIA